MDHPEPSSLVSTLKIAAPALDCEAVPFALAGGYAAYARGGHEKYHDVDFVIPPDAVPAAIEAMHRRGFTSSSRRRTGWSRSPSKATAST